ncbi:MAG: cyclic-di-AMP receptor [Chloroflexi bacterium]|nr:cyclic-di-AMP receptor [Chloroflexota bacterium]
MAGDRSTRVSILILAIVQFQDAANLIRELVRNGYRTTRIDAQGSFLQEGNVVVLIGTAEEYRRDVLDVISRVCRTRTALAPGVLVGDPLSMVSLPIEVEVGGAVVFALPVERSIRLAETGQGEPLEQHAVALRR